MGKLKHPKRTVLPYSDMRDMVGGGIDPVGETVQAEHCWAL